MATAEQNLLALKIWYDIQQGNDLNLNLNEPPMKNLGNAFIESMDTTAETARRETSIAYLRDEKVAKIIDIHTKIYNGNQDSKALFTSLSGYAFAHGYDDAALQLCRMDLKKNRSTYWTKALLSLLEAKAGNWEDAERLVIEAIQESKIDNIWYGNLAMLGSISGQDEKYLQSLIKRATSYGKHQLIFYDAFQLAINNEIDQAIAMAEMGYKLIKHEIGWLDIIAWHFILNKQYDVAYKFLHHERQIKKETFYFQLNHIILLALYNKTTEAKQLLSKIVSNKNRPFRIGNGFYKAASCNIKELESMLDNTDGLLTLVNKTRYY